MRVLVTGSNGFAGRWLVRRDFVGHRVIPEVDQSLVRRVDITHLVGSYDRLEAATWWRPTRSLDQTLHDLVHAEAN